MAISVLISVLVGILGSLIATGISAAFVLWRAAHVREDRAKPFIGEYEMLDPATKEPRDPGATVTVEHEQRPWWDTDTTPVLKASAKGARGQTDWDGMLEVRGLSDIATGFYLYPNRTGGALQFTLLGESEIMEQGHPHDPRYEKFERLLRRRKKSLPPSTSGAIPR